MNTQTRKSPRAKAASTRNQTRTAKAAPPDMETPDMETPDMEGEPQAAKDGADNKDSGHKNRESRANQPGRYRLPSVHPEGIKFILAGLAVTLCFWMLLDWHTIGWISLGFTLWIIFFFRDPDRVSPHDDTCVASPADGIICAITQCAPPPQLITLLPDDKLWRVSIFMSVFDVHVNRAPVAGTVKRISYVHGAFLNADLDKASDKNERQYFAIEQPSGLVIGMTQIAGLIARRIVRFVNEEDCVKQGQRVGLIRFGSRVDVYLPSSANITVLLGQRAIAGETVLARLAEGEKAGGEKATHEKKAAT